jgi:NitT/TauT family transport system substrate-binding protein
MRELQITSSTHRRIQKSVLSAAMLITPMLSCMAFAAAQGLVNVRISVDYRLYGSNAPLWFAQDSGLFRAAGINAIVDGSSSSGEAINRVASGAYDAAYADVGTLAEFWSRNPKVAPKLVMVILDRSAQPIVSLKKANVTMKDLVGRKVGTGQADATSRLFPAVLKVNDIAMEKINVMPVEQRKLRN